MPSYKRPGVYVEETLSAVNTSSTDGATVAAFLGAYNRGPTTPVLLTSWSDFNTYFGGLNVEFDLGFAVYTFFGSGGRLAYVSRVAGAGAVTATRILNDTATTPVPTLQVDAVNPGTWGNDIYITIEQSAAGTDYFDLTVSYGGADERYIVERFSGLSLTQTDLRYAPNVINGISKYITVSNLNSATAPPGNLPAVQDATALASGADGAAVTGSDISGALSVFDPVTDVLLLNLPGVTDTSAVNAALTYAENRGDIFVIIDPPANNSINDVLLYSGALTQSSYGAVYYPRIVIPDPLTAARGVTRTVAPGGAVSGRYATTDTQRGVFKAPAGLSTSLGGVVALEKTLAPSELDTLNVSVPPVNAIRQVPGAGICIMGARTLRSGFSDKYIPVRRSMIYLRKNLINLTQFAIFEPNDERLWEQITDVVSTFLTQFWQEGGLRGTTPAQAFFVRCDATNNTTSTIQQGIVNVEVGVALEYPAEFIVIRIGQFEGGAAVTEA